MNEITISVQRTCPTMPQINRFTGAFSHSTERFRVKETISLLFHMSTQKMEETVITITILSVSFLHSQHVKNPQGIPMSEIKNISLICFLIAFFISSKIRKSGDSPFVHCSIYTCHFHSRKVVRVKCPSASEEVPTYDPCKYILAPLIISSWTFMTDPDRVAWASRIKKRKNIKTGIIFIITIILPRSKLMRSSL